MKPSVLITFASLAAMVAHSAWSADYRVTRSLQLSASSTEVWQDIGDFCDIDDWHPEIVTCSVKVVDGKLHRVMTTTAGADIVEQRIAEEPGLSYTYKVANWPLPIEKYTATLSVEPNDGTQVTWAARFSADDPKMEAEIEKVMDAGMSAIKARFEGQ